MVLIPVCAPPTVGPDTTTWLPVVVYTFIPFDPKKDNPLLWIVPLDPETVKVFPPPPGAATDIFIPFELTVILALVAAVEVPARVYAPDPPLMSIEFCVWTDCAKDAEAVIVLPFRPKVILFPLLNCTLPEAVDALLPAIPITLD
jgi:hypothetical protein